MMTTTKGKFWQYKDPSSSSITTLSKGEEKNKNNGTEVKERKERTRTRAKKEKWETKKGRDEKREKKRKQKKETTILGKILSIVSRETKITTIKRYPSYRR